MTSAFQSNAFQNNAFQIVFTPTPVVTGSASNDIFLCPVPAFSNRSDIRLEDPTKKCAGGGVGWDPAWDKRRRLRYDPEQLEKLVGKYGEDERQELLEEIIEEARIVAQDAANKAQRKALTKAVAAVERVQEPSNELLLALHAAVSAKRIKDSIDVAKYAAAIARARYEYEMEQDEEEALVLLLN
jgi:hypothetical protein